MVIAISKKDKLRLLQLLTRTNIIFVPIGVNVSNSEHYKLPPSKTLLFLGALDISPNVEALNYFLHVIFPTIIQRIPEVRLLIVGSNPSSEILRLENERIKVLGFVENLNEVFAKTRALIFPYRLPYGSRVKVLEAMANGVPSIIFKQSIQGMELDDAEGVFSVSTDVEFIERTVELLIDDFLWKKSSIGVFNFSRKNFSNEVVYSALLDSIKKL